MLTRYTMSDTPGAGATMSTPLTFCFSSRRRHTIFDCDWSSDVCSSDLGAKARRVDAVHGARAAHHLLALEPVGGARVLLDRQRIVAESHDELAALGGERRGPEERSGAQQRKSPDHGCLSVRGRSAKWRATAVMSSAATRSAVNGPVRPLPLTARMFAAPTPPTPSGGSAPVPNPERAP